MGIYEADAQALELAGYARLPFASAEAALRALDETFQGVVVTDIREALTLHKGDVRATIEALRIPRKAFYDKLQRYGLSRRDFAE